MARTSYWLWFWRVISWDTLVPAFLLLVPEAVGSLFPKAESLFVVAAVLLPIVAFALRLYAGWRQIALNRCSRRVRDLQLVALMIGILPLVVVDCMLILTPGFGPQGKIKPSLGLWLVLAGILGFYLVAVIIAMYPGRTVSAED